MIHLIFGQKISIPIKCESLKIYKKKMDDLQSDGIWQMWSGFRIIQMSFMYVE